MKKKILLLSVALSVMAVAGWSQQAVWKTQSGEFDALDLSSGELEITLKDGAVNFSEPSMRGLYSIPFEDFDEFSAWDPTVGLVFNSAEGKDMYVLITYSDQSQIQRDFELATSIWINRKPFEELEIYQNEFKFSNGETLGFHVDAEISFKFLYNNSEGRTLSFVCISPDSEESVINVKVPGNEVIFEYEDGILSVIFGDDIVTIPNQNIIYFDVSEIDLEYRSGWAFPCIAEKVNVSLVFKEDNGEMRYWTPDYEIDRGAVLTYPILGSNPSFPDDIFKLSWEGEGNHTSVSDVNANDTKVYFAGGRLNIESNALIGEVALYNLSGLLVSRLYVANSSLSVNLDLPAGVYIVKFGDNVGKIVMPR